MRAAVSRMTLIFCPLFHDGASGLRPHCSYMLIEFGDGTREVWHDPPRDVFDNVYLGVVAERIIHPCSRDALHIPERSN
jgi:hypothetical protein